MMNISKPTIFTLGRFMKLNACAMFGVLLAGLTFLCTPGCDKATDTGESEVKEDAPLEASGKSLNANPVISNTVNEVKEQPWPILDDKTLKEWLAKGLTFNTSVEKVLAGDYYGYKLAPPIDWACSNIQSRLVCDRIHGFCALDVVIRKYEGTKDVRCGKLLHDYVLDWVRANPTPLQGNECAWRDEATARRVYRMSYCHKFLPSLWNDLERDEIKRSLDAQAELLALESFYTKRHNHGMHQDLALLCYSFCVCDNAARRKAYMDLALKRSLDYFNYAFCKNGVHKEHSPTYGRIVADTVLIFAKLLENYRPEEAKRYEAHYLKAQEFLAFCTMPNGKWPSIGDSSMGPSGFKYGCETNNAVVFRDKKTGGGYAVFRSSGHDAPDKATWIMFLAATFGSTHKHSDDLSFLLYHKGDLFVEAGNRDYNYANPMTTYAYSGYAHNVLCVDDKDFPVNVNKSGFRSVPKSALNTMILDSVVDGPVVSVTGVQVRFPGILQERTLSYEKSIHEVTVMDRFLANRNFKASLLFHIAPDVVARIEKNQILLMRKETTVATMKFDGSVEVVPRIVTGPGAPPYHTWIFGGRKDPQCGSLVIVDANCTIGENIIQSSIELL